MSPHVLFPLGHCGLGLARVLDGPLTAWPSVAYVESTTAPRDRVVVWIERPPPRTLWSQRAVGSFVLILRADSTPSA